MFRNILGKLGLSNGDETTTDEAETVGRTALIDEWGMGHDNVTGPNVGTEGKIPSGPVTHGIQESEPTTPDGVEHNDLVMFKIRRETSPFCKNEIIGRVAENRENLTLIESSNAWWVITGPSNRVYKLKHREAIYCGQDVHMARQAE